MSPARFSPLDGEQERLDACSREPIRTPGAIQLHGALLAIDPETFVVEFVSDNSTELLGREPATILGRGLGAVLPPALVQACLGVLDEDTAAANPLSFSVAGAPFDVIVHRSATHVIVEFEPLAEAPDSHSAPALYAAMHRLATATSPADLWKRTALEIQRLTGFDRVMVYQFHPDGHGEIVAEEVGGGLEEYFGLHYPASDIPAQARALYLTKLSRVISSSAPENSILLTGADTPPAAAAELDLAGAELRSVSPHHRQFMRNMGQASTVSFSLIHDGVLVGMITCAHQSPRRVSYTLRQGLEILANQVALQVGAMVEIARLKRSVVSRGLRNELLEQLADDGDLVTALFGGPTTVLDLIPADGVVLRLDGAVTSIGHSLGEREIAALGVRALQLGPTDLLGSAGLPHEFPELALQLPGIAGLILLPLGSGGDYLAWLRQELTLTVRWLGDQSPSNRVTPLAPRSSFSAWRASVDGTSVPWGDLPQDAVAFRRDLDGALLRRAQSQLAALALHDALTGLPNRRLMMDRLEHALTKYARGEELSVLFIDLDGFKAINDSAGHAAGDAMIRHAAAQLITTTRVQDTVARLGGDEFVVLCENTTVEDADVVAARIVEAIRQPILVDGRPVAVTASVGIASANLSFSASDLVDHADAAMYRAKAKGRNRTSR